jgi:DNA-binding transcriptional regulator YiaG
MRPERIRALRAKLRLSQMKFAALVGVTSNTVARWERGELGLSGTSAKLLDKLAEDRAIRRPIRRPR